MQEPEHLPPRPGSIAAILPAAGSGRRFGSHHNKLFALLAGKPLWYHAAFRLRRCSLVGRMVMPVAAADRPFFEGEFAALVSELEVELVEGGEQRTDSVAAGLRQLSGDESIRLVAVHDAARPLVGDADLQSVFAVASQTGAAILAAPVAGTIKRVIGQSDCQTVDRRDLWTALTPQVFRPDLLKLAYEKHRGRPATDDAELVERIGHSVSIVKGSANNLKITLPEDLLLAEAILSQQADHA